MNYSEKLRDPRWQKKRLEILELGEWKCKFCTDTKESLHVHHLMYHDKLEPWQYENNEMVVLCATCHNKLHSLDTTEIIQKGALKIYDLIKLHPIYLYIFKTIENHKGMWSVEFRDDVSHWGVMSAMSGINDFMGEHDGQLEIVGDPKKRNWCLYLKVMKEPTKRMKKLAGPCPKAKNLPK